MSPTFAEYSSRWLQNYRKADGSPLAEKSTTEIRRRLDRDILPVLGEIKVSDLTPAIVDQWFSDLHPDRAAMNEALRSLVRQILNAAVVDPAIPLEANPVNRTPVPMPRSESGRRREHGNDETTLTMAAELLSEFPGDRSLSPRARMALLVLCGLRPGDIRLLMDGVAELWRAGLAKRNTAGGWSPTRLAWEIQRRRSRHFVDPGLL